MPRSAAARRRAGVLRRAIRRATRALAVALAALPLAAAAAHAQPTLDVEVAGFSAMVWRGVTTTNRPVVNPTVALTAPVRGLELTLGAWANAEAFHYDRATMLDSYGGANGPLFTMHEAWVEAARDVRGATLALGASTYLYPRAADLSSYNTVELHASVTFPDAFATTVAYHHDVAAIGGGYLELLASRDVQVAGGRALALAASAGWSTGQGAGMRDDAVAYFARDGFTHAEGSVAAPLEVGRLTVTPSLHVALAHDAWTRAVAPDRDRRLKAWLGTSIGWSRALGRAAASASRAPDAR